MRQTWHIFLKDARRLRYEIIVVLVLTAAYAWLQGQGHWSPVVTVFTSRLNDLASILRVTLMPMAWWLLVSLAVYGEPLSGNRQFWLTRPYRRTSLLGAKLLFIVAFVSFPLLLADCSILLMQGLRPWESPLGFTWHELTLFAVLILPMIGVASITANFGQAVLMALVAIVPPFVLAPFLGPQLIRGTIYTSAGYTIGGEGVTDVGLWLAYNCAVVASAALAITILQYRTRRTWVSRLIFAAGVLLLVVGGRFLPGNQTFALQSPLRKSGLDTSSITAVLLAEGNRSPTLPRAPRNPLSDEFMDVNLPIRFDGIPSGTAVVVEMMFGEVTPPNRKPLDELLYFGGVPPDMVWHQALMERNVFDLLKGAPVRVHLTIHLTVLGEPHSAHMPLGGGAYRLPGGELCDLMTLPVGPFGRLLSCRTAFRRPAYLLAQFDGSEDPLRREEQQKNYSPFPAEFAINPVSTFSLVVPKDATTVSFTTMTPLAHIRRELDIPSLQLTEFAN